MAIQVRRGANANFDKSKMLPGEFAVTTDGTRKVYAAFASNDVKELASKDDVQGLINNFSQVVDKEIADAEQRIESKGQQVLDTIPDIYEEVSQKADEAVRTKADAIVCTASGVDIVTKDSSDDNLRNLKLFGKTEQQTTTGKNLLENTATSQTINGVTFTVNKDKSITANGTATANTYFVVNSNVNLKGEYILNGCPSGGSNSTYYLYVQGLFPNDIGNGATFTFDETSKQIGIGIMSGTTVSNLTFYPMIRLASITDSTYEPYTNGASPNPQYPQELESKGKMGNLFNKDTVTDGKAIGSTGGEYSADNSFVSDYIEIAPLKDYNKIGASGGWVSFYDDSKEYIYNTSAESFTTPTNAKYMRATAYLTDKDSFMIVEADSGITSYRPYSGQMEIESVVYGGNIFGGEEFANELVKVGGIKDGVNRTVQITGSLNMNMKTLYDCFSENEQYTVILNGNNSENQHSSLCFVYSDDTRDDIFFDKPSSTPITKVFTSQKGKTVKCLASIWGGGTTYFYYEKCGIFKGVITLEEFEVYKPKQSHISLVGDGLKGIPLGKTIPDVIANSPIHMSGVYWDKKTQQYYLGDTVDCERGVLVQRIGVDDLGDLNWIYSSVDGWFQVAHKHIWADESIMCDCYVVNEYSEFKDKTIGGNDAYLVLFDSDYTDATELKNAVQGMKVQYILAEPIETPLSASELTSYKALKSNYKVTSIMNDCEVYTEVSYNADTEIWITNKIEERITKAISNLTI